MKKILATLLVATMLLSCLTFVGFAANVSFTTEATYPYPSMDDDNGKSGSRFALLDLGFAYMYEQYEGNGAVAYYDENEGSLDGYVPTVGDYVMVPYKVADAGGVEITGLTTSLSFDKNLFEYVTCGGYDGWLASGTENTPGVVAISVAGKAESAITEPCDVFYAIFEVKAVVDSDANPTDGETTAKFTFTKAGVGYVGAVVEEIASIQVSTMSMPVTGLTPGSAEPAEKEDVTIDDVAAGTASLVVPTKGGYDAANWASESFANIEDNVSAEDKAAAEKYSCAFATVDLTDKNYDAVGFALIAEDGTGVRFFEAKKVSATGAYGVVFFGTEQVLGWYKVAPAVKLNGEIIYDANNASEL